MNILVLASRTYAPLADVDTEIGKLSREDHVYPFGEADAPLRAEAVAKVAGIPVTRKPLDTARRVLLEMATERDTEIWLFVARDADTKRPTQGMADIQYLLDERNIPFRVISSPLSGAICVQLTNLRHAVDKAILATREAHRRMMTARALSLAAGVKTECDRFEQRLADSMAFRVGDDDLDAKWIRWLRTYEALCDGLRDAERLFDVRAVA